MPTSGEIRAKMIRDRIDQVETLKQKIPHVRVLPANDEIRKHFTHPSGEIGFPASGAADWPLDGFTQRRLRDGTITIEGGRTVEQAIAHGREQARARATSPRPPAPRRPESSGGSSTGGSPAT